MYDGWVDSVRASMAQGKRPRVDAVQRSFLPATSVPDSTDPPPQNATRPDRGFPIGVSLVPISPPDMEGVANAPLFLSTISGTQAVA